MPEVRPYPPSFPDKQFTKSLRKVSAAERARYELEMEELLQALSACNHPATDPRLQRWRPSRYRTGPSQVEIYEYRCWRVMRVVAAWLPEPRGGESALILLVGATLSHDHDRLQRLLKQHGPGIVGYGDS